MVGANKHCVFGNCNSSSRVGRPGYKHDNVFFAFPKPCLTIRKGGINDQKIRAEHISICEQCKICFQWVKSCRRTDSRFNNIGCITKDTYICHKHFIPPIGKNIDYQTVKPMPFSKVEEIIQKYSKKRKRSITDNESPRNCKFIPEDSEFETSPCTPVATECKVALSEQQLHLIKPLSATGQIINYQSVKPMSFSKEKEIIIQKNTIQQLHPNKILCARDDDMNEKLSNKPFTRSVSTQTTYTCHEMVKYQKENHALKAENKHLKDQLKQMNKKENNYVEKFQTRIETNDKMCKFYTGLVYPQILMLLSFLSLDNNDVNYLHSTAKSSSSSKRQKRYSNCQQILLTLVRLRTGLLLEDLAYRFHISRGFLSKTINTMIQAMFQKFSVIRPLMFPSREKVREHLPSCFSKFNNIRVIVDCAEIFCQVPSNFEHQGNLYSNYKAHTTFKVLIGCTPNGAVSFVSDLFEGSISDKDIVQKSNLLSLLNEDDLVLADRGFNIQDLTDPRKIQLNIPAFLMGREKLTPQEEMETKILARSRIYVEHVVGRLKNFRLLKKIIPLSM